MNLFNQISQQYKKDTNEVKHIAIVGAGFLGKSTVYEFMRHVKDMRISVICNRTLENGKNAYIEAGVNPVDIIKVDTQNQLNQAIKDGKYVITSDYNLVCQNKYISCVVDCTGSIEHSTLIGLCAIKNSKHLVLANAELDGTIGPILKRFADEAGVLYSNQDGDQPGVIMNLIRYVVSMGIIPIVAGNMKTFYDRYATPDKEVVGGGISQKDWGSQFNNSEAMTIAACDGTKLSFEMACVANATGFTAPKRGMTGAKCDNIYGVAETLSKEMVPKDRCHIKGYIDYVMCGNPGGGIYVLGYLDDEKDRKYLKYFKMGDGPIYTFYTPYHLVNFDMANTVRKMLFDNEPVITPISYKPVVEVVAIAKRDLKTGEKIDGIGSCEIFGVCENSDVARGENLLPVAFCENAILIKDVDKDSPITFDDICLDHLENKVSFNLWKQQF